MVMVYQTPPPVMTYPAALQQPVQILATGMESFLPFFTFFQGCRKLIRFFVKLQLAENFINWRGRLSH